MARFLDCFTKRNYSVGSSATLRTRPEFNGRSLQAQPCKMVEQYFMEDEHPDATPGATGSSIFKAK